jgi:hypothetical protein
MAVAFMPDNIPRSGSFVHDKLGAIRIVLKGLTRGFSDGDGLITSVDEVID